MELEILYHVEGTEGDTRCGKGSLASTGTPGWDLYPAVIPGRLSDRESHAHVHVIVDDVNDNAPELVSPEDPRVCENAAPGKVRQGELYLKPELLLVSSSERCLLIKASLSFHAKTPNHFTDFQNISGQEYFLRILHCWNIDFYLLVHMGCTAPLPPRLSHLCINSWAMKDSQVLHSKN